MQLKQVIDKTVKFFESKGIENPRVDTEYLFNHSLGLSRIDLYVNFEKLLSEGELETLRGLVKRRGQGEPVAYIVGEKEFYGYPFKVTPAVLIPRPETELIVDYALEWSQKNEKEEYRIVDLGCGSGCIGLSLLKRIPTAKLIAVDVSAEALEVARENATSLGVEDRVMFIEKDAAMIDLSDLTWNGETADMVVANPPYIAEGDDNVSTEVLKTEPHIALFCDNQGLDKPLSWITTISKILNPDGFFAMEMGYDQGTTLLEAAQKEIPQYQPTVRKDYNGFDRILCNQLK